MDVSTSVSEGLAVTSEVKRLWSLEDMLELYAASYLELLSTITDSVTKYSEADVAKKVRLEPEANLGLAQALSSLLGTPLSKELPVTSLGIKRFVKLLEKGCDAQQFALELKALRDRLIDECAASKWFKLPNNKTVYYELSQDFTRLGPVANAFPDVVFDLLESAKCHAFGLDTASVFHSVRAVESGVRALWLALGSPGPIKRTSPNWGDYAKASRAYIQDFPKHPKTQEWADRLPFYQECDGALLSVYKAWRNPVAHEVGRQYGEDPARDIFESVRGLLNRLSEHIDQDGNYKV